MQKTWMRRATVGGLGRALGLLLVVIMAAAPPKGTADPIERQTTELTACDDMGRAARGSREFPTPGTQTLTFGPSTDSGGVYIKGLGTVSHASIDNYFGGVMDQVRTASDARTGS